MKNLPPLCAFHAWGLRRWRALHRHESKGDYRRRCTSVASQCPRCKEKPWTSP